MAETGATGSVTLVDGRTSPSGYLTSPSPMGRLASVDVYITSLCNRHCTYCFLPQEFFSSGTRMSLDGFAGVVTWSLREGVSEITLLGGEPSLHPQFGDMVSHAAAHGLAVRVVTNGARRFRRLLADGTVGSHNLSRVAVSLDTLDPAVQDRFRGRGAWQDAMAAITLLREREVPFDINVTAVRSALGLGGTLGADEIPRRDEWESLVRQVRSRAGTRPGFFVEIERGFLAAGEPLAGCALADFSNLEVMPDGRAYRCGLLVDQPEMASLTMAGAELRFSRPQYGEQLLLATMPPSCDGCPVMRAEGRRACIYDKVDSCSSG